MSRESEWQLYVSEQMPGWATLGGESNDPYRTCIEPLCDFVKLTHAVKWMGTLAAYSLQGHQGLVNENELLNLTFAPEFALG